MLKTMPFFVPSHSFTLPALLALGVSWGLIACAPTQQAAQPSVNIQTEVKAASFYPYQLGLTWQYVPVDEPINSAPYTLEATGPTLFYGETVQGFHFSGRGTDRNLYRSYTADGAFLHGFTLPGLTVKMTPPWQEYPAAKAWKVGLAWSGSSRLDLIDVSGAVNRSLNTNYTYTVLEKRTLSLNNRSYEAWVINRQISGDGKDLFPASKDFWFVPYSGDIKTPEGLVLTQNNIPNAR